MKKKLRVLSLHLLLLLTGFTGTLFSQTSEEFVKLKKDTTKEVKGTNIELKADELHRFSNGFVILGNYLIPIQDSLVESKVESITPFTIFDLLERDTTSTKQQIKFSKKVDKVYVNNKIVSSPNEIDEEFTLIKFLPKNTTSPVLALRAKEYKRLSEVYEILNISMSYSGLSRDSTSADDKPSRDSTNSLTKDPLDPRFFNWKDGYWMVPVFWCIVGISVGLLLYMLIARFTSKPQQNSEDTTKKTLTGQPLDQSSSDAEVPAVSGQPSSAENGMELAPPINTSQASLEDIKSIFNQTLEPLTNQQEQTSKLLTMLNEKLDSIIRPLPQENTTPSVKLEQYADVLALKRFVEVIDKNVEETFTVINNHFFKSNEDSEVLSTIRAITYNYHHPVDPFPKQNTPNSKWLAILNRIEDNQGEITDAFFLDEFQRVTNGAAQIKAIKKFFFVEFLQAHIGKNLVLWEELANLEQFESSEVDFNKKQDVNFLRTKCEQYIEELISDAKKLSITVFYYKLLSKLETGESDKVPKNNDKISIKGYYTNVAGKAQEIKKNTGNQVIARVIFYGSHYKDVEQSTRTLARII